MKCLSDKKMLLFFYNELPENEKKLLERHLAACGRCREGYRKLSGFLNAVGREKVDISKNDLNTILENIGPVVKQENVLERLKQRFSLAAEEIIAALVKKPQVAAVALAVIVVVLLFQIANKQRIEVAREEVVDIEMELVFEDSNNTDVMLDIFNPNSSQKSSSTNISS